MSPSERHVVAPSTRVDTTVAVPGSKSIANRALVCATLARGTSTLHNVPDGDDTQRMIGALDAMSITYRTHGAVLEIDGGDLGSHDCVIDAGLAGTTSRFLVALSALRASSTTVTGQDALARRPLEDLIGALEQLGIVVERSGNGSLPITVRGGSILDDLVTIRGDVSSQFISALMLIGPYTERGLHIRLSTPLVSRPYVEMTASVMRAFGADVIIDGENIDISQGDYRPRTYIIEPDYSSAAFPIMAVAIRGGSVRITDLALASQQGDGVIVDIARTMGCDVTTNGDDVVVSRAPQSTPSPVNLDLRDASDLVPAVAVAAAFASGSSTITGVGFIRNKESDRLEDLATEMRKLGAIVTVQSDGLLINGPTSWRDAEVVTHHDHRLAMALSLASLSGIKVSVGDPDVVGKSWPGYWQDMENILGNGQSR